MIKFIYIFFFSLFISNPLWSMERHRYIQFSLGTGALNNNLDSSGFQSKTQAKSVLLGQLQFGYQDITSQMSYHFDFESLSAQINSPAGLSPQTVDIKNTRYKGYFLYPLSPHNLDNNLYWGLGYELQNQSGTQTTPNNLISDTEKQGLLLTGKYFLNFNQKWDMNHQLTLFLPILNKENSASSGNYQMSYGLLLQSYISYMISDTSQFFSGLNLNYNTTVYSGSGVRGTTDAKESQIGITIPVGIKWGF